MLDTPLAPLRPSLSHPALPGALERAAVAVARLGQALDAHPLLPAFLHRTRLEAVRRQAAVDGHGIDPWHLAAMLEGLRLRMDHALHIVDRGAIFEAARTALAMHRWLVEPDFDQEGEIQAAERHLSAAPSPSALLTAAVQMHRWLQAGGARPPIRAALVRFWVRQRLLPAPVPLTGPRSLGPEAPDGFAEWMCCFLDAVADEARDYHQLLRDLERGWLGARGKVAGRRSTSRAALAIDVLATAPLLSPTTLARAIGMSIKSATALLDGFVGDGIAVEVTHRSKRRLFGLAALAPLRDGAAPPRRPEPGRGRGRPPLLEVEPELARSPMSLPPVTKFERPAIDYSVLEAAIAECEQVVRSTKRTLDQLASVGSIT